MSPNLSFERFAVILALTGCSKATPAADTSTSTVRSDPSAPAQVVTQQAPPAETSIATATASALASPAPGGAASAMELRKHKGDMHQIGGGGGGGNGGQASCGAGSCTSEIKKK
jgi:hypothetical protein